MEVKECDFSKSSIKVLLYYPIYINTFALAYILEDIPNNKTMLFNWTDIVPKDLIETLNKDEWDVIYCFSSSDKEAIFRAEVRRLVEEKKLPYKISEPISSFPNQAKLGIDADIDYSNFSIKYLFFQNKVNVEWIHKLGTFFYEGHFKAKEENPNGRDTSDNPYLSKLLSLLLARGYETIHIETDIQDESKGLLRKLLHEEYGFKFKLTPNLPQNRANNTLKVITKGGQQSFEEIKRQVSKESDLKTFVIPDNIDYTSKTKLIAIYKEENKQLKKEDLDAVRSNFIGLSECIFDRSNQEEIFQNGIHIKFLEKNIQFIHESILEIAPKNEYSKEKFDNVKKSNPFLQSLELYNVAEDKVKKEFEELIKKKDENDFSKKAQQLLKIVKNDAQYLQIETNLDFIHCLNDHHVAEQTIDTNPPLTADFKDKFFCFSQILCKYFADEEKKLKILQNGLFLLKLVIENPNGFSKNHLDTNKEQQNLINDKKDEKETFIKEIENTCSSESKIPNFSDFFNMLRIVAEDLNYLIVDEQMLCEPRIIFKIFDNFDISEFEYLYSIELSEKLKDNS